MHPYFDEVGQDNWSLLETKQVPPPWVPRTEDHFATVKKAAPASVTNPQALRTRTGEVDSRRLTELDPALAGWTSVRRGTDAPEEMRAPKEVFG